MCVCGGGGGGTLDVAGSLLPAVPAGGSPQLFLRTLLAQMARLLQVGPCETVSPKFSQKSGSEEHSVLDHGGPAGRHIAVGPFRTLSSSDCHPAGPYVAGGPVGPDDSLKVLELLEHSVLDHADPAGQHAAMGPFRTLSSSDCHPAGPYVAGGPVGPDDLLKVLEPLEHSVLDHADLAGQHAVVQDVLEPLEHSVLDTILWRGSQFWSR